MKVAVIGCGSLGTSLARGLLRSKDRELRIKLCDPSRSKIDQLVKEFPDRDIVGVSLAQEAVEGAEVIIVAVKPKDVLRVLTQVRDGLKSDALVVSCAAGVTVAAMEKAAGKKTAIARVMPNTAISVAGGTTGIFLGAKCDVKRDEARLNRIFSLVGEVKSVADEEALHAVTALSGSGPAFVLLVLEAMIDAGVRAGLSRGDAEFFAKGALASASALAANSAYSPSDLRAQITSPAGTTIEGLYVLEKAGLRGTIMDAVETTYFRSLELTHMASVESDS